MQKKTKLATLLIILWILVIAGFVSDTIEPTTVEPVKAPIVHAKVNDPVPQVVPIPTVAMPEESKEPPKETVQMQEDETPSYVCVNSDEAAMMAITMRNESNGSTPEESMKVGWCICNRALNWGQSISHVISSPNQFAYYGGGLYSGYWYELATYVITDYYHELNGEPYEYYGRLLPSDMMWFQGDGYYNHFYNYCPY